MRNVLSFWTCSRYMWHINASWMHWKFYGLSHGRKMKEICAILHIVTYILHWLHDIHLILSDLNCKKIFEYVILHNASCFIRSFYATTSISHAQPADRNSLNPSCLNPSLISRTTDELSAAARPRTPHCSHSVLWVFVRVCGCVYFY